MKDLADKFTLDLVGGAKKRGRPSSGCAKSPAVRMRLMREKQVELWRSGKVQYSEMNLTALYDLLRWAVKGGSPEIARSVSSELCNRAQIVQNQGVNYPAKLKYLDIDLS